MRFMKLTTGRKIITGAIAAAVVLSGAGMVHNKVYAAQAKEKSALVSEKPSGAPDGSRREGGAGKDGRGKIAYKAGSLSEHTASILGVEATAIQEQLKQGQTLLQIAAAAGLSEEDYLAKLAALESAEIDASVASGKLTQEQADSLKAGLAERLKLHVEKAGGDRGHSKDIRSGKGWSSPVTKSEDLAGILGITEDELEAGLKEGKSLAELAEAKGITKEQLVNKIKDSLTDDLNTYVEKKGSSRQHPGKRAAEAKSTTDVQES